MQYNKAEERKAWDDIAFRLGVVVVVVVGRVRFGIGGDEGRTIRTKGKGTPPENRLAREVPAEEKNVQGRLIIPS